MPPLALTRRRGARNDKQEFQMDLRPMERIGYDPWTLLRPVYWLLIEKHWRQRHWVRRQFQESHRNAATQRADARSGEPRSREPRSGESGAAESEVQVQ